MQYVMWVTRGDADKVADSALRARAGVEDSRVEVKTNSLGKWDVAVIPAGSRDEWGTVLPKVLNVGSGQLPPEGRVYVVAPE
jgi:hypothetical protein